MELGLVVAGVLALGHVARSASAAATPLPSELDADGSHQLLDQHIVAYRLDGAMFFGAAQRFLTELTAVTDARVVILRMPDVQVLDGTAAHALGEIVSELEDRGITVLLKGPRPDHRRVLGAVGVLERLDEGHHVFDDLAAAVEHARLHVGSGAGN
jgi:SulP family sulfate permease